MPADVCWKRLKLNGCVPDIEEDKAAVGEVVQVEIRRVLRTKPADVCWKRLKKA
jgi:hypothetical protein